VAEVNIYINQFTQRLTPEYQSIVRNAAITLEQGNLTIDCGDWYLLFKDLMTAQKQLRAAAQNVDFINRITIKSDNQSFQIPVYVAGYLFGEDLNPEANKEYAELSSLVCDLLVNSCIEESKALQCLRYCQIYQTFFPKARRFYLVINSQDKETVKTVWEYRGIIAQNADTLGLPIFRQILYKGSIYGNFSSSNKDRKYTMDNENTGTRQIPNSQKHADRVKPYKPILSGFADQRTTVYLVDAEKLVYLDVSTGDPRRLNRSSSALIGNTFKINDPAIGEPREHWCKKAIASGHNEFFSYDYRDPDNRLFWSFESRVIFLPGQSELIVTVTDPADCDWQTQYWLNLTYEAAEK